MEQGRLKMCLNGLAIAIFKVSMLVKRAVGALLLFFIGIAAMPLHAQSVADSDGDGIPDAQELGSITTSDSICWDHNGNNGTSYAAAIGNAISGSISNPSDIIFGPGYTTPTSNFENVLNPIETSNWNDAKATGDYVEVSFTLSDSAVIDVVKQGIVPQAWGGTAAGDYNIALEISSDNFATSTLLFDDGFQPSATSGYAGASRSLGTDLTVGNTYAFRFYLFNEQNSYFPDNTIAFDDFCFDMSVSQAQAVAVSYTHLTLPTKA